MIGRSKVYSWRSGWQPPCNCTRLVSFTRKKPYSCSGIPVILSRIPAVVLPFPHVFLAYSFVFFVDSSISRDQYGPDGCASRKFFVVDVRNARQQQCTRCWCRRQTTDHRLRSRITARRFAANTVYLSGKDYSLTSCSHTRFNRSEGRHYTE